MSYYSEGCEIPSGREYATLAHMDAFDNDDCDETFPQCDETFPQGDETCVAADDDEIPDLEPRTLREEDSDDEDDWEDIYPMVVNHVAMIDKFGSDIEEVVPDMMLNAVEQGQVDYSKIDPAKYKDIFDKPGSFDEAWNHPEPFQRQKWRAAIMKEFDKMESRRVWTKVKKSEMEKGRRCVKCKWVLEIKRSGIFRARLVACGYSQVAGVDFVDIFSPVANDVSFQILLIMLIMLKLHSVIFDVETAFYMVN